MLCLMLRRLEMLLCGLIVLMRDVLVKTYPGVGDAFLGSKNFEYGIDRYIVVYPDGRGYAWNEINDCGEKLYDGSTKDQSCPPRLK